MGFVSGMPTVTKRWAAGDIDAEHARAISWLRNDRTEDAFAEWEPWLADQPVDHDHHGLRIVLRRWKLAAEPTTTDLTRTAKQRRHDAFVEIIRRARAADNETRSDPRPLVTVVTGVAALASGLAELWDDTPLSPAELAAILEDDPDIQRFVYGAGEAPTAYNPRARLFTGKLREAILTRDRRCAGRGCDADTRDRQPHVALWRHAPDRGRVETGGCGSKREPPPASLSGPRRPVPWSDRAARPRVG